jgi:hypothetical protein
MTFIPCHYVVYDSKTNQFEKGARIILNLNFIVSMQYAELGNAKKSIDIERLPIFWVNTTVNNAGDCLRVASEHLFQIFEQSYVKELV